MGKRLKSFTLKMIGGANVATIIIMLLIGYSGNINPAEHPTIASVGLFFPIFLVINLLFLVFWILFYWRGALIPILGYIVAYVPVRTYIPFNYPSAPPEGAIKVLSFNVYNFAVADGGRGLDNGIVDYIINSGADIVCLQEAAMYVLNLEEVVPELKRNIPTVSFMALTPTRTAFPSSQSTPFCAPNASNTTRIPILVSLITSILTVRKCLW